MTTIDVTYVTAPAGVGGAESVVAALSRGLAGRGHRIRLVALLGPSPEERCLAFDGLAEQGVELHEIRLPPRSYRAEWRRIERLLGERTTMAHCHGYHADLVGWRAARQAGRRLVSTVHGFTGGSRRNRAYEWLDRRILGRFDAVVAVSAPLRELLVAEGIRPERLHLIPNAIAPEPEAAGRHEARNALGLRADATVVGWVGRLSPEKGPDLFLEAMARLPRSVYGSIVGSGEMADPLRARADAMRLSDRLQWHGTVPGAARLFAAFDVLVISSRTEGTPIVLLEAMTAGIPVVTTPVGGIPAVVSEAEAFVVRDASPAAIAEGIAACLDHATDARARADRARARVTTGYGIEAWLDRHEHLYRSLQ